MDKVGKLMECMPSSPPLSERLKEKKRRLEQELDQINKVIEKMESNPEVSSILDAVSEMNLGRF